ncbi:MAG: hypothetical protein KGJ78_13075 [Alphaproteobacteria bacterium]|nr:hypothetical protein [Alphaproteobacteria bacterium]
MAYIGSVSGYRNDEATPAPSQPGHYTLSARRTAYLWAICAVGAAAAFVLAYGGAISTGY